MEQELPGITVDAKIEKRGFVVPQTKKQIRQQKWANFVKKMEKPMQIMGDIGTVASQGMELYSNIDQMKNLSDTEINNKIGGTLIDMQKGRSLMKKIRRRRIALYNRAVRHMA